MTDFVNSEEEECLENLFVRIKQSKVFKNYFRKVRRLNGKIMMQNMLKSSIQQGYKDCNVLHGRSEI